MKTIKPITSIKFLIILLASFFNLSCEKEETGGYGNYIIGISNSTSKRYHLNVIMDGETQGGFFVEATQTGNYSSGLCSDLVRTVNLDNVKVLTLVPTGKHKIVIKDYTTGKVMVSEYEITMKADGCFSQQIEF